MRSWAWCVGVALTVAMPVDAAVWEITQVTDYDKPGWNLWGGIEDIAVSETYVVWRELDDGTNLGIRVYDGNRIRSIGGGGPEGDPPEISGSNVVSAYGDAFEGTIFLYDGHDTVNLRGYGAGIAGYEVSGSYVAWAEYHGRSDGGPWAFLYDHAQGQVTEFREDFFDVQRGPRVSGSHMIWWESDGIHLYDIPCDAQQLLPDTEGVRFPELSDTHIAWRQGGSSDRPEDYEVFLYELESGTTTQLTDDGFEDAGEVLSGNRVAWKQFDDHDWEIFLHDGSNTLQLTENEYDDGGSFRISQSHLVWSGEDGNDSEIFVYDGSSVVQLTDNQFDEESLGLSGSYAAWRGYDGSDWEIFAYDGDGVVQLTDNDYDDRHPAVGGSRIAWAGRDGEDIEVFLATRIVPEPSVIALLIAGAAVLLIRGGKRRFG